MKYFIIFHLFVFICCFICLCPNRKQYIYFENVYSHLVSNPPGGPPKAARAAAPGGDFFGLTFDLYG